MNPYVYSAGCSWHGPIEETGKTDDGPLTINGVTMPDVGIPCCPHCGSVLFQVDSQAYWDESAKIHEANGHTNYVEFLKWTRTQPRCWPSLREAAKDFALITGKEVVWDLPA